MTLLGQSQIVRHRWIFGEWATVSGWRMAIDVIPNKELRSILGTSKAQVQRQICKWTDAHHTPEPQQAPHTHTHTNTFSAEIQSEMNAKRNSIRSNGKKLLPSAATRINAGAAYICYKWIAGSLDEDTKKQQLSAYFRAHKSNEIS